MCGGLSWRQVVTPNRFRKNRQRSTSPDSERARMGRARSLIDAPVKRMRNSGEYPEIPYFGLTTRSTDASSDDEYIHKEPKDFQRGKAHVR